MWIASLDGFISINQSFNGDDNIRHLKARRLEHFEEAFPDYLDDVDDKFANNEVHDYRFHLDVPTDVVTAWITESIKSIDYTGDTKGNVAKRWPELADPMMSIWGEMLSIQETDPIW
jgi:hypothetical protein